MNNLSWLIYVADVLPKVSSLASFSLGILLIAGGFAMFVWTMIWVEEEAAEKPWFGTFFGVILTLSLLVVFTPSKEAIYLIAGSEAGETVVTSEQGQEILNDVQQVIKFQLQKLQGSTTSTE